MYAIRRVEMKPGVWCWAVHFRRRAKSYSKGFYDQKLGGQRRALAEAMAWRDQQLARIETLSVREFRQLKRSSNRSGVPGVQFIRPKNQPLGSWQARLKLPDGKEITKTFAVGKHGDTRAFDLAVAARAELLATIDDHPFLHSQVAREFAAKVKAGKRSTPSNRHGS